MYKKTYHAFLFDLNGTMIDDMPFHIRAWHRIVNGMGANISMERAKAECYGKNHDFIERIFPGKYSYAEKDRMSLEKEKGYQQEYSQHLKLIGGLEDFLHEAKSAGIKTAIGSAAIRFNIDFVLDGLGLHHLIDAVVSADDVQDSKPHPETFLKCADALNVQPADCLVFEDTPKGVETALRAGMDCIVICTLHQPEEFAQYGNIIGFIDNYQNPQLTNLPWQKERAQ